MIQVIWKFVVKEEAAGRFERAYGTGGDWEKLFARFPGFRGTTLLRGPAQSRTYLTIDTWESRAQRQQMLDDARAKYAELDSRFAEWTESETEIGLFEVIARGA